MKTMPNNNNESPKLTLDSHRSGYFQAHLVQLDETMTDIFKAVYEIYNFLATEKLDNILPQDLTKIKPVLDSIRNFHCPLNHNEDKTDARDSRRVTWIEFHHTIFQKIRDHIPGLPDGKINYDFTILAQKYRALIELTEAWIHYLESIPLGENFYVRIKFYQLHQKAIHFKCPLGHTYSIMDTMQESRTLRRTKEQTETLFISLTRRMHDLYESFGDDPHYLHTNKEPIPHPDFFSFL